VSAWLGEDGIPVRVGAGEPDLLAVGLATPDGELVLRLDS
jgi:hypothetical protein